MFWFWAIGLTIFNLVCLFLVALGLPGTWLMVVAAALLAWLYTPPAGGAMFGLATLVIAVLLATLGEVFEFFAGVAGAQKAGGGKRAATGAIIGGLVGGLFGTGLIPIPIVGSVLGAAVGAGGGALAIEIMGGQKLSPSVKIGVGAGMGRLAGTVLKLAVGVAMWAVLAVATFWP